MRARLIEDLWHFILRRNLSRTKMPCDATFFERKGATTSRRENFPLAITTRRLRCGNGSRVSRSPRGMTGKVLPSFSYATPDSAEWPRMGPRLLALHCAVTTDVADISIIWRSIQPTRPAGSVSAYWMNASRVYAALASSVFLSW
jgi:hypothetical protein